MALVVIFTLGVSLGLANPVLAERKLAFPIATELSAGEQELLYARLTGQDFSGEKSSLVEQAIKCGTPLAGLNLDHSATNPLLRPIVSAFFDRVTMQASYDSPEGHFKLHYNTVGDSAIKDATVDLAGALGAGGPDGVPDYINAVGDIFDSVWNIILGPRSSGNRNLGYPLPPGDGSFLTALNPDSLYDIYFVNLRGFFFGATVRETLVGGHYLSSPQSQSYTSYIQLDNDFFELSYSHVNDYRAKPLDAVRVTAAHEFFHAIHFGIDATEFEFQAGVARLFWFEMSAVSMEEYQYDDIDDYYGYLFNSSSRIPFDAPHMSIETFSFISDFPYAMGVFPIWLTNKFGPDLVRGIWLGCGAPGPDFLRAVDSALTDFTNGEYDFNRAFAEFGAALALSGDRAKFAPPGFGFEEAEFYPTIRDTLFQRKPFGGIDTLILGPSHDSYPFPVQPFKDLNPIPQSNSNSFVFLHEVTGIQGACFKPQVIAPLLLPPGFELRLTLVAIPQNQFDTALIVTAPFDELVVDTILLLDELALDSSIQNLVDSFGCHDFLTIDTLNPASLNDLQPDSIHLKVEDIVPGIVLPDPTRYSDVMLLVTQTSSSPADYENVLGILEYPYAYTVRDSSVMNQTTRVHLETVTAAPGDVVGVGVYLGGNAEELSGMRIPLRYNSTSVTPDSVSAVGSILDPRMTLIQSVDTDSGYFGVQVRPLSPEPIPAVVADSGLLCTFWFTVSLSAGPQDIILDSLNTVDTISTAPFEIEFRRVEFVDHSGLTTLLPESFTRGHILLTITDVGDDDSEPTLPKKFELDQNYPNPFNPSTKIGFSLPSRSAVRLEVFNLRGQRVTTLFSSELGAGQHEFEWDATSSPSGIYLYRLKSVLGIRTKKMMLLK